MSDELTEKVWRAYWGFENQPQMKITESEAKATRAAIVAVLEPVRKWVVQHGQAANACAASDNRLMQGSQENHIGAASACEEITMYLDALLSRYKAGAE